VLSIGSITPANEEFARTVNASVVQATVSALADRLVTRSNKERLKRQLAWAGKPNTEDLRAAMERKILYGVAGVSLGFLFGVLVGGLGWLVFPAGALVGYYLPDILAYNAGVKRTEEIQRTLPDALDLLNLCVESGLSLQAGLMRVAQAQTGAVAEEFGRVLREMQLGVARSDAFESLGKRTNQEDMHRFVAAILQVDRLGIPVSSVLREQASEMRAKRRARAREQAQKVPVKILMPLMLCLLPGLFIIILGPAVLTMVDTLGG
jgi:tight adherence protein C